MNFTSRCKFRLFLVTSLFLRGYGGCVQLLITYWDKNMLHIRKFFFKEISRCHNAMNPKISDFYVSLYCPMLMVSNHQQQHSHLWTHIKTTSPPPHPTPPSFASCPKRKILKNILCRHLLQNCQIWEEHGWPFLTLRSCTDSHYLRLTICICLWHHSMSYF